MEQPPQTQTQKGIGKVTDILRSLGRANWLLTLLAAFLVFLLVKKFLFSVVQMNGAGMSATYDYGDALLVKRSFNSFAKNDIVYFEFPAKDSLRPKGFFIQRICALPGDSLEIIAKEVYVNNIKDTSAPSSLKHNYFIRTNKAKLDSLFKVEYYLTEGGEISDEFDYSYSLTYAESERLKKDSLIQSVEIKSEKPGQADEQCFPSCIHYPWNMDHYGKIYIPRKNDTLKLDTLNINLYADIIGEFEGKKLEVRNDSIFINAQHVKEYVVEQDYYFVLGDNRSNSNDSRVWGYLPKSCIKGKVIARIYKNKS